MKIEQTAGREKLGKFAPKFAELNDDILFGDIWNRQDKLSIRERIIVTIVSIVAQGMTDSSFEYHLQNAKKHGIDKSEIAEILTHVAFYVGWPKVWSAFNIATNIYKENEENMNAMNKHQSKMIFPIGEFNSEFAQYFIGKSYLAPISLDQVKIFNVTFEPTCRNNWHIHNATKGGGQMLICIAGEGYYQEYGKEPIKLQLGDIVNIPVGVKHWHGATADSWFSHLSVEVPGENCNNQWLEEVSDEVYFALNK